MATGTLTISTDLMNSWLLKRLRPTSSPLVRGRESVATATVTVEKEPRIEHQLTVEQEIKVLAHATRELEDAYGDVIKSLNTIHRRKLDDFSVPFGQRVGALALALEADDIESARECAKRLMVVIAEMQSNIPAWDFVRALQLLAQQCQALQK